VARYQMEENGGTTLADSSPPANDGTIHGNPTWVMGQDGLALRLDGTGDYAVVPNDYCLNITGAITLAGWVKPSTTYKYACSPRTRRDSLRLEPT